METTKKPLDKSNLVRIDKSFNGTEPHYPIVIRDGNYKAIGFIYQGTHTRQGNHVYEYRLINAEKKVVAREENLQYLETKIVPEKREDLAKAYQRAKKLEAAQEIEQKNLAKKEEKTISR